MRTLLIICLFISGLFSQSNEDIKKKIIESGLSETQIRQMAKQRGMTDAQIDAKAKEIKGESSAGEAPQPVIEDIPEVGIDDVSLELGAKETAAKSDIEQVSQVQPGKQPLAYFGYDIFKRDPALFQASVFGAVDPDYNIGPGDEIIFMLWGETQFRQVLSVDREGFIFIPEVGQVFVNGLTMDLLESKMFKVLSQRYSSLVRSNGGNPTTFLDISLGNLRPLRILGVGEVAQPGAFRVSPSTTLFSSLYYFNGPTTLGSLRDVQLIRGGKQISSIDFYDYLLSGKKLADVRLQLDDTIFLPPRGKTVSIEGEINRPAIYELKDDEGLLDILKLAGNLKASAYLDRIQIDRIVPVDKREAMGMDRMYVDINIKALIDSNNDFALLDGDVIQVFQVMDLRKNYVEIRGNVERPGTYEIENGLRVSNLIELSDGLINDAYLELAHLIRINEDLTHNLFEIDLSTALKGDENADMELQPFDVILIYNKNSIFNAFKTVEINGSVKRPGRYPFFEGMTMNDLLIHGLAGEAVASGGFHADNIAPTLFGGIILIRSYEPLDILNLPVPKNLFSTAVLPDFVVNTMDARHMLPKRVPLKSAVEQAGNLAGFTLGLHESDFDLLGRSMVDLFAEPIRAELIPGYHSVRQSAMDAGAIGCGISGSGPTLFALSDSLEIAKQIGATMVDAFKKAGLKSTPYSTPIHTKPPEILD